MTGSISQFTLRMELGQDSPSFPHACHAKLPHKAEANMATRALALILLVLVPVTGLATEIDPALDFAKTVEGAELIFSGSVKGIVVEWHPSGYFPVTVVTFDNVRRVKGSRSKSQTIELRFWGGRIGSDLYVVEDQPAFEIGGRYILMSAADGGSEKNGYSPVVGKNRGMFRVIPHSGKTTVLDGEGRPIVRVVERRLVVVGGAPNPNTQSDHQTRRTVAHKPLVEVLRQDEDPGTRLTEQEFIDTITEMIKGK